MMSGVSAAHVYQPGASDAKTRTTEIDWPPPRANITVSNVESAAGTVQSATTTQGDTRGRSPEGGSVVAGIARLPKDSTRTRR